MTLQPPAKYALCQNAACERVQTCLRYRAFLNLPATLDTIYVVSPLRYPQDGNPCTYYRELRTIRLAWGVRNLLRDLPYERAKQIKQDLLTHFGRTRYYRFFREEMALTPTEQDEVRRVFLMNGIETAPAFSRFTEEIAWW